MPVVNIKVIEGVFSQDQKQEMIRRMTNVLVDLEGEYMRPFTVVVIEEVKSGDWGVGGKALSRADVKALAGGSRKFCPLLTTCPKSADTLDSGSTDFTKGGLA